MSIVFLLHDSCSLLVRVHTTLLPLAVLFCLIWPLLRRGRTGPSVPLINAHCWCGCFRPPAIGGAISFLVSSLPSWTDWSYGSANKCSLLVRVLTTLLPGEVFLRLLWSLLRRMRGGPTVPLVNITMDKQIQPLINLENTSVRSYAPIF